MVEETLPMNNEADWNTVGMDLDMNMDMGDSTTIGGSYGTSQGAFDGLMSNSLLAEDFFSHELLALGLQEPLPPQDMQDELYVISASLNFEANEVSRQAYDILQYLPPEHANTT